MSSDSSASSSSGSSSSSSEDEEPVVSVESTTTTKTDRISIALLGVHTITSRKTPWFSDISVTQVGKTSMFAPIHEDFTHLIFYNSQLLRIVSSQINVSAVVPRTVMMEYAPILKDAPVGSVFYAPKRFFICIERSAKSKDDADVILEGFRTVIQLCQKAKTPVTKKFFYISNGSKKWKVERFTPIRDEIVELQNIIVSYNKHGNDTDDKGKERTTKAGQKRAKPVTARGECWERSPYVGKLTLMNPTIDESSQVEPPEGEDQAPSELIPSSSLEPSSSDCKKPSRSQSKVRKPGKTTQKESKVHKPVAQEPVPSPGDDAGPSGEAADPPTKQRQEDPDSILKQKVTEIVQGPPEAKKVAPFVETVGDSSDEEEIDEDESCTEEDDTESQHILKRARLSPPTRESGTEWCNRLPQKIGLAEAKASEPTAGLSGKSATSVGSSTDLDILELSHQQVLEGMPKKKREQMGACSSKESFKSAVELYSSEPLKEKDFVPSPVIKSPEFVGLQTRSKTTARLQARGILKKTGQAIKNKRTAKK